MVITLTVKVFDLYREEIVLFLTVNNHNCSAISQSFTEILKKDHTSSARPQKLKEHYETAKEALFRLSAFVHTNTNDRAFGPPTAA